MKFKIALLGALAGTLADDITTYLGVNIYGLDAEVSNKKERPSLHRTAQAGHVLHNAR